MVHGAIPAAKISEDARTSLPAAANRLRKGHKAQSARGGRAENTPGFTIAPRAQRAPYPNQELSRSEPRSSSVAATRSVNINAESAVSQTQTVEKNSDIGKSTQIQAAAAPTRLPNAFAPMA